MTKKRSSIKNSEGNIEFRERYEKYARDIAFRARIEIEVDDLDVYIADGDGREHLYKASSSEGVWIGAWKALLKRYPHLKSFR